MNPLAALQLADWRRQTAALYARVREPADPAAAHALWRDGRDQMMRSHPQSPPTRSESVACRTALRPGAAVDRASSRPRGRSSSRPTLARMA
jgi:hypothetical protein